QRTLEKMRLKGGGPKFRKHGRYVRYHIDELDEWSKGHPQDATSEHGSAPSDEGGQS
ncbi:DNA-binding protein, partial [bacterium M00.F.Ca.ET.179.01.1.1]